MLFQTVPEYEMFPQLYLKHLILVQFESVLLGAQTMFFPVT